MQLNKYELKFKITKTDIRFVCPRFLISSFFSVKYWHLLTIGEVWHIPTVIRSHIWQLISSDLVLFVYDNCYVEMNVPSRLRVQLDPCPSFSNASTNDLRISTSSVSGLIDRFNALDRVFVAFALQFIQNFISGTLKDRPTFSVLTNGGYVNIWLMRTSLRVDGTVVGLRRRKISLTEIIHCRIGRGGLWTIPLFLMWIVCE